MLFTLTLPQGQTYLVRTVTTSNGEFKIAEYELENAISPDGEIDSQLAGYVSETALLTLSDTDLLTLLDLNP
jgi:hypothetical protein